jgi:hypothetical protein
MSISNFFNKLLDQLFDLNEPGLEKFTTIPYIVVFMFVLLVIFFGLIYALQWLFS